MWLVLPTHIHERNLSVQTRGLWCYMLFFKFLSGLLPHRRGTEWGMVGSSAFNKKKKTTTNKVITLD